MPWLLKSSARSGQTCSTAVHPSFRQTWTTRLRRKLLANPNPLDPATLHEDHVAWCRVMQSSASRQAPDSSLDVVWLLVAHCWASHGYTGPWKRKWKARPWQAKTQRPRKWITESFFRPLAVLGFACCRFKCSFLFDSGSGFSYFLAGYLKFV